MRDPRYDILFTPVQIGPVVAKNRFFQVPHCNGMGHAMPLAHAAMREAKAEGGWAVVSTEECEIHPSSDLTPYVEARLWDDRDIPALALMCDKVHAHGALAALELTWSDAGYHAFSADGGPWCAVSSAGEVLTGVTPDELDRKIRTHWEAMQ